ncbi:MAG TPA: DUF5658 family protein [Dehalococcoidales bacterium]|nr:DUF5658 family protein [Dehalococcoidales bacterium]
MVVITKVTSNGKRKIIALLSALVGLVVIDGVLTNILVGSGSASEANPILEPMVGRTGFMIIKIVGSLLCALILWDVWRRYPRVGTIAAWIAVIGYAAIVVWNAGLILLA